MTWRNMYVLHHLWASLNKTGGPGGMRSLFSGQKRCVNWFAVPLPLRLWEFWGQGLHLFCSPLCSQRYLLNTCSNSPRNTCWFIDWKKMKPNAITIVLRQKETGSKLNGVDFLLSKPLSSQLARSLRKELRDKWALHNSLLPSLPRRKRVEIFSVAFYIFLQV